MLNLQIFKFYKIFILFFCLLPINVPIAFAETDLKKMQITEPPNAGVIKHLHYPLSKNVQKTSEILTPLDLKKSLIPLAELKDFEELPLFMGIRSTASLNKALKIVTKKSSEVPPIAFYYLSHALAEEKNFESAAFYYTLAELRNSFDKLRFPPYKIVPKAREEFKNLTEDQKLNTPKVQAKIINPQRAYEPLVQNLGQKTRAWIIQNPPKYADILERVKLWDKATEYGYKPPYDLSSAVDEKEWAGLLEKNRTNFFEVQKIFLENLESNPKNPSSRPSGR